jgi:fatty acid desaturase
LRLSPRTSIRIALIGAAICWIAYLTHISQVNYRNNPHAGTVFHTLEHVAAFGLLGVLLLVACKNRMQEWIVLVALLCFATALELRQHQIFHNPFEWWDVRDDAIGLALAWLGIRAVGWRRKLVR